MHTRTVRYKYILRYLFTSIISVFAKIIFLFTFFFPRCKSVILIDILISWSPLSSLSMNACSRLTDILILYIYPFKNKINLAYYLIDIIIFNTYYTPHYGSETIL